MLKSLVFGELQRLKKYNVSLVTFLVVLLWSALLYFIEDNGLFNTVLPFVVVFDITFMPLLYVGAILFFEKSESTLFSLTVTPVSDTLMIWSKLIANVIHQVIATSLVILIFMFIKDVDVNIIPTLLVMILSILLYTLFGFVFTYTSKDFTTMLTHVMVLMIFFSIPSILISLQFITIPDWLSYFLLLNPFESTLYVISSVFNHGYTLKTYLGLFIQILWFILIYTFYVKKNYMSFIQKGSQL
jgi:fluoroquinolone transport system permease protein